MPSEKQVMNSLEKILVPGVTRSLHEMNLIHTVKIDDHKVDISLFSAALAPETEAWLRDTIKDTIGKLSGVDELHVDFVVKKPVEINKIGNVIAVMSGKGGVGKSLVTSLVAIALKRRGYDVGILDADITGPSIPKMFGVAQRPAGSDTGLLPVLSKSGIELMSINLLIPSEDDAVIWRGPIIAKAIMQFWEDVLWGKLDYLIVDLPPGTADAPLTVMQSLPISGVIIVFTPQNLTAMIVKKAVKMAHQMNKPVLGVVENMSYLQVPETGKKIEVFGRSKGKEMAVAAGAPLLGRLPIDPALAKLCDEGLIERYDSEIIGKLGESLSALALPEKK